jgi:hypothetical protein
MVRLRALFLIGAAAVLAACGSAAPVAQSSAAVNSPGSSSPASPASSSSAASPATASISAADVTTVAREIFIGVNGGECRTICPLTDRLSARVAQLEQPPAVGPGPLAPFCRCQNVGDPVVASEITATGGVAHVVLGSIKIDLIMVDANGSLLVDDTQCTGAGSGSSIYQPMLAPCG